MKDDYLFMIKSFSRHFRSHNIQYDMILADEVIFFGHSLGSTDYHYFEHFFRNQSNEQIKKEDSKIITEAGYRLYELPRNIMFDNKKQKLDLISSKINDLLISELITINTGLSEETNDEELTPINSLDTIIKDCLSVTGYNELVTSFAYGQGDKLFNIISDVLGEDNTKKFYNSIDNYYSDTTKNAMIYSVCMNALINSIDKDNGLKM